MSDRKWNVVRLWLLVLIVAGFGTIDRAVAQNVAAEVEDETVFFGRIEPKAATDHLVVQPR